jgi:hypothetical protein
MLEIVASEKKDVNNFVFNIDEKKVEDLFVVCVFALPLSLSCSF